MNLGHTDPVVGHYYYYRSLNRDYAPDEGSQASLQHGRNIPPWTLADTVGFIAMFSTPFAIAPLVYTGAGVLVPIVAGPIAAKGAVAGTSLVFSATLFSTKALIQAALGLVAGVSGFFLSRRR